MIKIAPSILSADFSNLGLEISKLKGYGADLIHIDVMDGHFVPNITIGPSVIKDLRRYSDLLFDVHLMITNPDKYITQFADSGADIITIHIECDIDIEDTVNMIKSHNKKVGISLNPSTPISRIENILDKVDIALVMSVYPGFGGQKFIQSSIDKIRELKDLISSRELSAQIEVDGGITLDNAKSVVEAGADILVAGSAIFGANNIKETIKQFKSI